jgi:CheY-like chemotaxis protein/HPt (histidine-containing phosphotransfer) domain-containing protein
MDAAQKKIHDDGSSREPSARARVLLVEDNRINQQFATLILNKAGYQVELAVNGREGVDKYATSAFDIVLMDIQMPVLDGLSATREIRSLPSPKNAVPIVGVSAHAIAGSREEALAAGMDDYICKPFQPPLLLQIVARHLGEKDSGGASAATSAVPAEAINDNNLAVLDFAQLSLFESAFSSAKMRTLASLYIIDAEARLTLIGECRVAEDFEGISRQAHMIVSTAGNLGAKRTSALARILEEACARRDTAQCDLQIADLRKACWESSQALKTWLEEGRGGNSRLRSDLGRA